MLRFAACIVLCLACCVEATPVSAQTDGSCCYVIGVRVILVKGRPTNDYKKFCGDDYDCAISRLGDYEFASNKACTSPCSDLDCPPCHRMTTAHRVKVQVQLLCCGCDGVEYVATGEGRDWCAAFKDAKQTACEIGKDYHCGLRSYSILKDEAACPPPQCHKPIGIFKRIFNR